MTSVGRFHTIAAFMVAVYFVFSYEISACAEEGERRSFMAFPAAFYTTDTGFGGGAAAVKSYRPERERLSAVQGVFIYTVKKQTTAALRWDHYLQNNRDKLNLELSYNKFPMDYFGLGNHTPNDDPLRYTPEFFESKTSFERRIIGAFRVKATVLLRNQALLKEDVKGALTASGAHWAGGRFDTGAALALAFDNRDNIFATKTGRFVQVEYRGSLYASDGGSFDRLTVDMRSFSSPFAHIIFASMLVFEHVGGDVPFYLLPYLGSQDRLRGYEHERFTGDSLILAQQDVRFPIWGPIGGAVFGATGRVAREPGDLFAGTYHTALGAGLRFLFNKEDNMVLRGDFAKGSDSTGVYITFSEAF